MRYALAALFLLSACDSPPEGVAANDRVARVFTLALVRARPGGGVDILPDPPDAAVQAWLMREGFVYDYFDADTSAAVERVLAPLREDRPPGESVVSGYYVYRR
jgi:hypothetical protein